MKLTDTQLDEIEKAAKDRLDQMVAVLRGCQVSETVVEYGTRHERDLLMLVDEVRAQRHALERTITQARLAFENALKNDEEQYGTGCRDAGRIMLSILGEDA